MPDNSAYLEKIIEMLADCRMFDDFSPGELKSLSAYFHLTEIPANGEIFREGDTGTFMGIIHDGEVAVFKADSDDRNIELTTLKRGKAFGEMAVLDGERRSATCVARRGCSLLTLSGDSLDRMMETSPGLAARVVRIVAVSLSRRLRIADFKLTEHQL